MNELLTYQLTDISHSISDHEMSFDIKHTSSIISG